MPDDPLIGFQTDSVRFDELLGKGAMGSVYRGLQLGLERQVAIKVIAPHLAGDSDYIERFGREAHTIGKLVHPNVIACHDFGPAKGPRGEQLYLMVLEYVDGWSLGSLVKSKRTLVRQILELHRQAAEGLHAAHQLGIVHRDIKPDNIMVTRIGEAKLADFGLARQLEGAHLTQAGAVLGSPAYMSPEACRGEDPTPASDIYSLGCSLYQTLTGHSTFEAPSAIQVLQLHITAPIPQLATHRPDLAYLQPVIQKCLAKHPAHRFPNAHAVAKAIHAVGVQTPRDLAAGRSAQVDLPSTLGEQATLLTQQPQVATSPTVPLQRGSPSGRSAVPRTATNSGRSASSTNSRRRTQRTWMGAGAIGLAVIAGLTAIGMAGRATAHSVNTTGAAESPRPQALDPSKSGEPTARTRDSEQPGDDAHLREMDGKLNLIQSQIKANDLPAAQRGLDTLVVVGERLKKRRRQINDDLAARWAQQEGDIRQRLDDLERSIDQDPVSVLAQARLIAISEHFAELGVRRDSLVQRATSIKALHASQPRPEARAPNGETTTPPSPQTVTLRPAEHVIGTPIVLGHSYLPGRTPISESPAFAYSQMGDGPEGHCSMLIINLPKGSGAANDGLILVLHSGTSDSRCIKVEMKSPDGSVRQLQPVQLSGSSWETVRIPLPDATPSNRQLCLRAEGDRPFYYAAGVFGSGSMPAVDSLGITPGTLSNMLTRSSLGWKDLIQKLLKARSDFPQFEQYRLVVPDALYRTSGSQVQLQQHQRLVDAINNRLLVPLGADGPKPAERPTVARVVTTSFSPATMKSLVDRAVVSKANIEFVMLSTMKGPESKPDEAVAAFQSAIEKGLLPVLVLSPDAIEGKARTEWVAWQAAVQAKIPGLPIIDLTAVPLYYAKQDQIIDINSKIGKDLVMAGFEAGLIELRARIAFGVTSWPVPR
ncbi:MAG: serine/threonine protein kinase [Planctomycetes bacterium]|nr:serine/threonine protein kinase [Planctomycetota bacterium]